MVTHMTQSQAMNKLADYFQISQGSHTAPAQIKYDAQRDTYTVINADVLLWGSDDVMTQLPIQFDVVHGKFYIPNAGLTTLQGSPDQVKGSFVAHGNKLTTLVHGPTWVEKDYQIYNNPLKNLDGFPTHVGGDCFITYHKQLPLLRLLVVQGELHLSKAPAIVYEIMNKYAGKGKTLMLNCARDLKQAGYAGNATW